MPFDLGTILTINQQALASLDRVITEARVGAKTSSTGARCSRVKETEALEIVTRVIKRELKFDPHLMPDYLQHYPDLMSYQSAESKPLGEALEEAVIGKIRAALNDRIVEKCLEQYVDFSLEIIFESMEEPYLKIFRHIPDAAARRVKSAITGLEDDPTHKNVLSLMYALNICTGEAELAAFKLSNQNHDAEATQLYQAARDIEELNEFFALHLAKDGFEEILSRSPKFTR